MLSVQSLQTLRGAAAVDSCRYSRVPRALSLACSTLRVLARAQAVPNSLCQSRAAPAFWLGQSAAFTRRLDSSALQRFQRRRLITAVSCGVA